MRHHEEAEQKTLFAWASYYPILKWMHAIPNGGNRKKTEAARLKGQGVKPGVHDIFLPLAKRSYHGLYIEMKRRKQDGPSRITEGQLVFASDMLEEGYLVCFCYGADEAIELIKWYCGLSDGEKPSTLAK